HPGHENATQAGYSSPQPSQERSSTTTGSNTTSSSPQHSASTAYQSDSYASEPKAETKPKPSKKQKANSTGQYKNSEAKTCQQGHTTNTSKDTESCTRPALTSAISFSAPSHASLQPSAINTLTRSKTNLQNSAPTKS